MKRALLAMPLALLTLTAACDDETPATTVLVTVDSDLQVGSQLSKVQIEVRNSKGERKSPRQDFILTEGTPKGSTVRLPFSFGISKGSDKDFQLAATGLDDGGDPVVEFKVSAAFEDGKTLGLHVFLGKLCLNNFCTDSAETCYPRDKGDVDAGSCDAMPKDSLPVVDPDMELPDRVDAGDVSDAAMADASDVVDGGEAGSGGRAGGGGAGRAGNGGAGSGGAGSGGAGSGGAGGGGSGGAPAQCSNCNPGETCVAGRCTCAGALTTHYRDADGDGFGDLAMKRTACGNPPSGWATSSTDCCDSDNRAFPGQTNGFDTASNCADNGFDFNCDGFEEPAFVYFASGQCCTASAQAGWTTGHIPACGDSDSAEECDANCLVVPGLLTQICR
jgi:hypothetical protein